MNFLANMFGWVMNIICLFLSFLGIVNVPVGIIVFAIVVTILMIPITIGQLRFALAKVKMAPKMQAIHDKYAQKTDLTEEEVKKQSEEINAVYKEAGVTPSGKIIGFVIQFILIMAMYRVAGNVTTYVPMFSDADGAAFLFFQRNVSELPMEVLKNGFDLTTCFILLTIFLTMIPFSLLRKKDWTNFVKGIILASLLTVISLKMPMGLCIYWASKSIAGMIINSILQRILAHKNEKESHSLGEKVTG